MKPSKINVEPAGTAIFLIVFSLCLIFSQTSQAQGVFTAASGAQAAPQPTGAGAISVDEWLARMHEASMKRRTYIGTLMQSSREGMSGARIWHSCDGSAQVERIESLTGIARSSIRHNDRIVTLLPEQKLVRLEQREGFVGSSNFTELLKPGSAQLAAYYSIKGLGSERVAGLEADMVLIQARDAQRYGYRLWTDKKTALVLKLQTLDATGEVLEQTAFSEVQQGAPVNAAKLMQMMRPVDGWRSERADAKKISPDQEGWQIKPTIAGFKQVSCLQRTQDGLPNQSTLQWVFSDGLATISLFIESYDKSRHGQDGASVSMGATSSLYRRMNDHFLTAMGEVPLQTLKQFVQAVQRKSP